MPGLRGAADGGCEAMGVWGTLRHRIHSDGADQHGATHAWTEIYIPGAGWRGFDPTNNTFAGAEHVSIAVARDAEKASPLCGAWEGPAEAFDRMEVTVKVVQV